MMGNKIFPKFILPIRKFMFALSLFSLQLEGEMDANLIPYSCVVQDISNPYF